MIKKFIKRMLFVEYRLTYYVGGHTKNVYGTSRKAMMGRLKAFRCIGLWTLYKKGPFWLTERAIDWGEGRCPDLEN